MGANRIRSSRRRPALFAAAAALGATVIAVGVTVAALRSGGAAPQPRITDGNRFAPAHIRARIGPAVELVAQTGDTGLMRDAGDPVARAEQAFSMDLVRQLSSTHNVSVSPASLSIALSMLQNGAGGTTRDQIRSALHTSGLSDLAQNAGWADLAAAWADSSFDTANSVWLQQDFAVRPEFLDALARYYDAGVWQVNFAGANAAAVDALNTWTSRQTRGRIPKLFEELDRDTKLVLANAAYFRAAWATPFAATDTAPRPFTRPDGTSVSTPFLHADGLDVPAAVTSHYQAVQLPYRGGRFAALAVMPRAGSLGDFTARLTTGRLAAIVSSLHEQTVALSLPKFTTRSTLSLQHTLSTLGMPLAFSDHADFTALTPRAVRVGKVIQRVHLSVGEMGTEAAAATGVTVEPSAARVTDATIAFDRPLLFLIRDVHSGAIAFATQVNDPSAG